MPRMTCGPEPHTRSAPRRPSRARTGVRSRAARRGTSRRRREHAPPRRLPRPRACRRARRPRAAKLCGRAAPSRARRAGSATSCTARSRSARPLPCRRARSDLSGQPLMEKPGTTQRSQRLVLRARAVVVRMVVGDVHHHEAGRRSMAAQSGEPRNAKQPPPLPPPHLDAPPVASVPSRLPTTSPCGRESDGYLRGRLR